MRPVTLTGIAPDASGIDFTLAFLRCLVPGLDVPVGNDEHVRSTLHFMTEVRLDGYQQSQYEWYKANTLVSATASLTFISTTTDLSFRMAVDFVEPDLRQHDGTLAFKVGLGAWMQDDAWFGGYEELKGRAAYKFAKAAAQAATARDQKGC